MYARRPNRDGAIWRGWSSTRVSTISLHTWVREGARYRKLARSRGKGKAQVAVGNTQLRVYHKLLSNPDMRYQDLGPATTNGRRPPTARSPTTSARPKPSASKSPSPASPNPTLAEQQPPRPPDPAPPPQPTTQPVAGCCRAPS